MSFIYRRQKMIKTLLVLVLFFAPVVVGAAIEYDPGTTFEGDELIEETTGLGGAEPVAVASRIINVGLTVLGLFVLCLMLFGGYMWMNAKGNEEQVTKAKKILEGAAIGLIIILASYGVANFVFYNIWRTTDPYSLNE